MSNISNGGNATPTKPTCTPNWQCESWQPLPEEVCSGEEFTQTCSNWIDENDCGLTETPTTTQKAIGTKDCSTPQETSPEPVS